MQTIPSLRVQIGNGDIIHGNKVCRDLHVKLPGLTITQDYYPFSIGGADLVFDIKWLASLNTIQANWKEMFMIFNWQGKRNKLQGIRSTKQSTASFQSFNKISDTSGHVNSKNEAAVDPDKVSEV